MPGASIYDPLFRSSRFLSIWDERTHLSAMLEVEAALAKAAAAAGLIPSDAADDIATCCNVDLLDVSVLRQEASHAGNLAIPLVQQLTAVVLARDARAAGFVHWGATSQDIIDTATVLQLGQHLDLIAQLIDAACRALAGLADTHRDTMMPGRTWLQHAVPTTFGLKVAGWLDAMLRHRERLEQLRPRLLALQFGGAAGTLASFGDAGPRVATHLANELRITVADMPWHSARDRFAEAATFHGLLVGTLGKIARDISLATQTEVAEFHESAAGGSSTMPQKQNPVTSAVLLAAALRVPPLVSTMLSAMVQEQERGLGGWHAEWETLPEICLLVGGALDAFARMLPGLRIDGARMAQNLSLTRGLILAESVSAALAKKIGRDQAHAIVKAASLAAIESGEHLTEILQRDEQVMLHLSAGELNELLTPENNAGSSAAFIDAVLARFHTAFAGKAS